MTSFPGVPLTLLPEVALGADLTADPATWVFTSATSMFYTREPVTITRGRSDQTSAAEPCSLAATVDNRLGYWSSRQPASPWYGQLRQGTPIRVSTEGHVRFTGFLSALPPKWDLSGKDRFAQIEAKGLLYRLNQNRSPFRSPLRRSISAASPTEYWPMEEGSLATMLSSATGGPALNLNGARVGVGTIPLGGSAAVDLSNDSSIFGATGISPGTATSWEFSAVVGWDTFPTIAGGNFACILRLATPGATLASVGFLLVNDFRSDNPAAYQAGVYYATTSGTVGDAVSSTVSLDLVAGSPAHLRCTLEQSGGDTLMTLYVNGVSAGTTLTGASIPQLPTAVTINPSDVFAGSNVVDQASPSSFSHLAIWTPKQTADTTYAATDGYNGELAHVRFGRLCDEENIPNTTAATESQALGRQGIKAFVDLLRECEQADQAFLYEGTDFGLVFQSHTERENLTAALTLNYTTPGHVAPPLEPTDDDSGTINDAEVIRDGGSSARLDTDMVPGYSGLELAIQNIGRRDDSQTYSLATDDQPYNLAGWRLHVGTWPGYRFPSVTLNLAAGPGLISSFCAADLAFKLTITNPPSDIGPDAPSLIAEGYSETLGPYGWDVTINCSDANPWHVGVYAADSGDTGAFLGHYDWDTCAVHQATVTSGATSFTVDTTPLMTTTADDFPFDIVNSKGERMTVTNCTGSSNPQTLTVTRAVNGVASTMVTTDPLTLHPDYACYLGL